MPSRPASKTVRHWQTMLRQQEYLERIKLLPTDLRLVNDPDTVEEIHDILSLLAPSTAVGIEKLRIGGSGDGGYAMLDPGEGGIAYSFGVSAVSPWDMEMAERDFSVHQYDGTIDREPDRHPNIHFNKYNIAPSFAEASGWKSLHTILRDNGHENERDIILQMDIEGGEWPFLIDITTEDLLRFKQIIVELHDLHVEPRKRTALEKLRATHTPVHIHYNNARDPVFVPDLRCFYTPYALEASYARTADFAFTPCADYFPTEQDSPNVPHRPEIPIGCFDLILLNTK